jgi:hypothetical protein
MQLIGETKTRYPKNPLSFSGFQKEVNLFRGVSMDSNDTNKNKEPENIEKTRIEQRIKQKAEQKAEQKTEQKTEQKVRPENAPPDKAPETTKEIEPEAAGVGETEKLPEKPRRSRRRPPEEFYDDYYDYDEEDYEYYDYPPPRRRRARPYYEDEYYAGPRKKPAKKPKQKSAFGVFMMFVTVLAIIAFCVTLAYVANILFGPFTGDGQNNNEPPPVTVSPPVNDKRDVKVIVLKIFENKRLEVYDFNGGQVLALLFDNNSAIKNMMDETLTFEDLKLGDIAEVSFYWNTKNVASFKISPDAWEKSSVNGIKIDNVTKTITLGDETFSFDARILALYKGAPAELSSLSRTDVIRAKGYGASILFIEVLKSHGIIQISNKEKVVDGTLEIGNVYHANLADVSGAFEIPEGKYTIIVKGTNIENFQTEANVAAGERTVIDLNNTAFKSGALNVRITPGDATLFIDDVQRASDSPIVVQYGTHKVRVEKAGFDSHEREVFLKDALLNVDIVLTQSVELAAVHIKTVPEGASVEIDGINYGPSPVAVNILPGEHSVRAFMENYEDVVSPITVEIDTSGAPLELGFVLKEIQSEDVYVPVTPTTTGGRRETLAPPVVSATPKTSATPTPSDDDEGFEDEPTPTPPPVTPPPSPAPTETSIEMRVVY